MTHQDVNIKTADSVTLIGEFVQELSSDSLTESQAAQLRWLCESLILTKPAAASVLLYAKGQVLARFGVMGNEAQIQPGAPVFAKALRVGAASAQETYLPAVQNLPGKVEFTYLPENVQTVLLMPILQSTGAVVLGGSQARAFTPKDIAYYKAASERVAACLAG